MNLKYSIKRVNIVKRNNNFKKKKNNKDQDAF